MSCRRKTVSINGKKFSARVPGSGCKRRRHLVWGAKARAAARSRANKNPAFREARSALKEANSICKRTGKAFSKTRGACLRKALNAQGIGR